MPARRLCYSVLSGRLLSASLPYWPDLPYLPLDYLQLDFPVRWLMTPRAISSSCISLRCSIRRPGWSEGQGVASPNVPASGQVKAALSA